MGQLLPALHKNTCVGVLKHTGGQKTNFFFLTKHDHNWEWNPGLMWCQRLVLSQSLGLPLHTVCCLLHRNSMNRIILSRTTHVKTW